MENKRLVVTARFNTELGMIEGLRRSEKILEEYCSNKKDLAFEITPSFENKTYSIYMNDGDTKGSSEVDKKDSRGE